MEALDLRKKCSSNVNVEVSDLTKKSAVDSDLKKQITSLDLQMPKLTKMDMDEEITEMKNEIFSTPMKKQIQLMEEKIQEEFKAIQQMTDNLKNLTNNIIKKENEYKTNQEISTLEEKCSSSSFNSYPTLKRRLLSSIEENNSNLEEKCASNNFNNYPTLKRRLLLSTEEENSNFEENKSVIQYPIFKKLLTGESSTNLKNVSNKQLNMAESDENNNIEVKNALSEEKLSDETIKFEPVENIVPESELNFTENEVSKNDEITENMEKNIECKSEESSQLLSKVNFKKKKRTRKFRNRKVGFGYVAVDRNKNGEIHKFSLGTFTEIVTIKNCKGNFFEKLEHYMQKFNLSYVYMIKEKNSKLEKNKRCIKTFNLKNISDKCARCKQINCTAGRVSFYFVHFHSINFYDCEKPI